MIAMRSKLIYFMRKLLTKVSEKWILYLFLGMDSSSAWNYINYRCVTSFPHRFIQSFVFKCPIELQDSPRRPLRIINLASLTVRAFPRILMHFQTN